MSSRPNHFIFRFTYCRHKEGWSVKDTLTDEVIAVYPSESQAISAALEATAACSLVAMRPSSEPIALL
jgi:hypothetical protein